MASSPKVSKARFHARSASFPSEPHPTVSEYDEILSRIASSEAASCSSFSSIRNHLDGLHDLHDCLDSLLLFPGTQQALAKECHGQWVDEILDGSLGLLDVCSTAKDSLLLTKECTQEIQSALRRKGSDASKEAGRYLDCRKMIKRSIIKALKNLKGLKTTKKREQDSLYMISLLREVEQVTLSVLEALLSFVSGPKEQLLVSKLMQSKRSISKNESANEFEQIDVAIQSMVKNKSAGIENIQSHLADLELSVEDLESGIECLYKHLIKTRVTLLNILSH